MKRQKNQTRKKTNYLRMFIIVVILGLIVWGVFVLMYQLSKKSTNSADNSNNTATQQQEDTAKSDNTNDTNDDKDDSGGSDKPQTPTTDPNTGLKNVSVLISYAGSANGRVSASGWVANVTETTGVCTYIFTNTSTNATITETASSYSNPSSTSCESVKINQSQFSLGEWSVILKYQSNSSEGESESVVFQIK